MLVRLLGPVELLDGAGPVRLGGEKERTALAAMAVARPRPVHGALQRAALWDEAPPRSAVKSVQAYISRLRSVAGDAITRTDAGYLLHADVDLETVERLVAEGRQQMDDGDAELAAERFAEALSLWTGPSLSGVAATHPMELARARLEELARPPAEHRLDALLRCGHGSTLVGELEVMVGEEPLRERRWAQLLTALYRSGRQSDALRAYQRLRATLSEELGIDPSVELQELERRILARDPSLGPRSGSSPAMPLDALGAVSRPTTGFAVPLPDRLGPPTTPFAGRAAELARLRAAWDRATTSGRRGVIVAGEPGIGKSTLVGRFARAVHADGAVVVAGACTDDLGIAHRPWIEILAPLVEHLPVEILADHVSSRGGVLSRLVPSLGRRVELPATDVVGPEAERYLLFGAVVDLLGRVPAPLLVVIDDLHWADRSSVQLLRHVISSPSVPDVLVVGTYRPTDVDHGAPLPSAIAELRQVGGVEFVSLGGLDDAELLDLVRSTHHELAGGDVALRDALTAETGGNPFFTLEILRHLAETGALGLRELGLPVSVRQVIGQRVARLGGTTHRVLREAAVIGREFDLDVLAGVADINPDELLELLEAAVAAAVVVNPEGDRFHFAHALIEHALYAELLPARRVRTHRRVASWLEQRCGADPGDRVGELAHHWAQAVSIEGPGRAIEWARRAGDHAMEKLAPDEAVRWYSRALELLETGSDDQELRRTLHVGLGNAERQSGDPMHRRRLLDAAHLARRVGDVDVLVEVALANNSGVYSAVGEVDDERVAVLELALADVGDADDRSRARLLATLSAELTFSGSPRTCELAADAVTAARRCGDADTLCDVLTLTEVTRRVPWLLDERDRFTREALDLTADGADPVRRFNAALKRHHVLVVRAERAEARRHLEEAEAIADRLELPNLRWIVRRDRVLDAVLDGDLELAETRAADALEMDTAAGQTDAFTRYSAQLMAIRRHQGRLGELVPAITRLVADKPAVATFSAALASAHVAAGQVDLARPIFAELTADLDRVAAGPLWSTHMGLLADTAIALDHHEVVADLYERLLPHGHQISTVVGVACDGAISHRLGRLAAMLGRRRDAVGHLTDALERHRRLESPLHVAETEHALARITA
ncbi:MAG: BTAD domain-containing putative transcriptional regulator [Ilumatobacteraceae bacterium]